MFTVQIRVLGIPCEAQGNVSPAEPSVGLYRALEDVTLHNAKNGSRLKWLETKLDNQTGAWDKVYDAIWAELDKPQDWRE
jgi:hypothetical protein